MFRPRWHFLPSPPPRPDRVRPYNAVTSGSLPRPLSLDFCRSRYQEEAEEEDTRTMLRVFMLVVALGQLQVTTRSVVQSVYRLHLASHVGFLVLVPADANVDRSFRAAL